MYNMFCTGGINAEDPFNSVDNVENGVMVFFRDYFAAALNSVSVKIAVLILFLLYLVKKTYVFLSLYITHTKTHTRIHTHTNADT